jgi:hypothetical protein
VALILIVEHPEESGELVVPINIPSTTTHEANIYSPPDKAVALSVRGIQRRGSGSANG